MNIRKHRGFSLLEVLIAIVILSFGLLAIAALQGRLLRNTSDTNARTIAMNIGHGVVDRFRSIMSLETDLATSDATAAGGTLGDFDYGDIATGDLSDIDVLGGDASSTTVTVGNTIFTPSWTVTDCYRDGAGSFDCSGASADDSPPDFKKLLVTVAWTDEAGDPQNVQFEEIIAGVGPADSGILLDDFTLGGLGPQVTYTPQPAPEVVKVPVGLGGTRFKETTEPAPDILRNEFSTITTFSTITFDSSDAEFLAQRQEDFITLNCRCTLQADETTDGREPYVWNGDEYVEALIFDGDGNVVANSKPTGIVSSSISNQPDLCTECCANHHDSDQSVESFDPFRLASDRNAQGDHKHYLATVDPDTQAQVLTEATPLGDNQEYDEVCRFVRVDGIFELAQDFQLVAFNTLPQSQLEDSTKLAAYQEYVVNTVTTYLGRLGTNCSSPSAVDSSCYPGALPDTTDSSIFTQASIDDTPEATMESLAAAATSTPTADSRPRLNTYDTDGDGELSDSELSAFHSDFGLKPFNSRGILVDYLNDYTQPGLNDYSLRECIDILRGATTPVPDDVPSYCDPLEADTLDVLPFFEVNVTGLSFWSISGGDYLILYQAIADGIEQVYRRGDVRLFTATGENATISSSQDFSNSGLTDTLPIDPADSSNELSATALIDATAEADEPVEVLINLAIANNVSDVLPANVTTNGVALYTVDPVTGSRTLLTTDVDCSTKQSETKLKCTFDPTWLINANLAMAFDMGGYVRDPDADGVFDNHYVCASSTPNNQLAAGETAIGVLGQRVSSDGTTSETTRIFVGGNSASTFPTCDSSQPSSSPTGCPTDPNFVINASVKKTGSCSTTTL